MNYTRNNPTVFITTDRPRRLAVHYPSNADPFSVDWPPDIDGAGVILLDRRGLAEDEAQRLGVALKSAGAECVIWADFVKQDTSWLLRGAH